MNKTLEYYLELPYTIELSRTPDEGWFVRVKELPGCMSQGDTAEEALEMIQEAMSLWLETALEDGLTIPKPRPVEDYSGKFVVRLPRSLHRDLAERAAEEGVSLNQFVAAALAQAVGRAQASPPHPSESRSEASWPGLKTGVRRALLAAGLEEDAGELDEQLFGRWFDQLLSQVESSLRDDYARESGLPYLETLAASLQAAAVRSPAIASLHRAVRLLQQQVEAQLRLQQTMLGGGAWRYRRAAAEQRRVETLLDALGQGLESESRPSRRHLAEPGRPRYFLHRETREK
jgi:antitoxin HicB